MLQTKLASLQQIVTSLQQASDLSWKALIAEDRLLSRVETLETQLQAFSKNSSEEKLRDELQKLNDDKGSYQEIAKECLKKAIEEKLDAIQKFEDTKMTLLYTETECTNFKEMMERNQEELQQLASKLSAQIAKNDELEMKIQVTESETKDTITKLKSDNLELNKEVQRLLQNETVLQDRIRKFESSVVQDEDHYKIELLPHDHLSDILSSVSEVSATSELPERHIYLERIEDRQDEGHNTSSNMDSLFIKLAASLQEQNKTSEVVNHISTDIKVLQDEKSKKIQRINALEYDIEVLSMQLRGYREHNLCLEERIAKLEERADADDMTILDSASEKTEVFETEMEDEEIGGDEEEGEKGEDTVIDLDEFLEEDDDEEEEVAQSDETERSKVRLKVSRIRKMIVRLYVSLDDAKRKIVAAEEKVTVLQSELESEKLSLFETSESLVCTKEKLKDAQTLRLEKESNVLQLKEEMKLLENKLLEVSLPEKLNLDNSINNQEEENHLLRKQLTESQQIARQNKNEVEQLREQLQLIKEEHEKPGNLETSVKRDNQFDNRAIEDYNTVYEERKKLRDTVIKLETTILQLKIERELKREPCSPKPDTEDVQQTTAVASEEFDVNTVASAKITELEEELAEVMENFSTCSEEKTRLEQKCSDLEKERNNNLQQNMFYVLQQNIMPLAIVPILIALYFVYGAFHKY